MNILDFSEKQYIQSIKIKKKSVTHKIKHV